MKHNGQLFLDDHIAEDHIHTDITTCINEDPQQKYRLGTVSNTILGSLEGGALTCFTISKPSAFASVVGF